MTMMMWIALLSLQCDQKATKMTIDHINPSIVVDDVETVVVDESSPSNSCCTVASTAENELFALKQVLWAKGYL